MAKRKRLEPLSPAELAELLDNNPSKQGLERILRFDLDKVTTRLNASAEEVPFPATAVEGNPNEMRRESVHGESLRSDSLTSEPKRGANRPNGVYEHQENELVTDNTGFSPKILLQSESLPSKPMLAETLRSEIAPGDSLPSGTLRIQSLPSKHEPTSEAPDEPTPVSPSDSHLTESLRSASLPLASPRSDLLLKVTPTVDVAGVGKRKYYRCTLVQDAHTPGEDKLLAAMSRLSRRKGQLLSDGSVLLAASMDELSEAASMHRTNVRNNLKGLIEKLAIDVTKDRDVHLQAPRAYRIFTYRQILERRRASGMEWVVKNRGVTFVRTAEVDNALRSESLRSDSSYSDELLRSEPLPEQGSESHQALRSESLPPSLLGTSSLGRTSQTSSSVVAAALMHEFGFIDDDALACLIAKCRHNAPDATDEEIAELGAMQARRLRQMRRVDNPIGLLITQVAKCFKGEPFAIYRREKAERARRLEQLYDENNQDL